MMMNVYHRYKFFKRHKAFLDDQETVEDGPESDWPATL